MREKHNQISKNILICRTMDEPKPLHACEKMHDIALKHESIYLQVKLFLIVNKINTCKTNL